VLVKANARTRTKQCRRVAIRVNIIISLYVTAQIIGAAGGKGSFVERRLTDRKTKYQCNKDNVCELSHAYSPSIPH
jgi:hypothetical protein